MMKSKVIMLCAFCAIANGTTPAWAGESAAPATEAKTRIGAYDSRAVAVAYIESPAFKKWLAELKGKRDRANLSGNQKMARKLDAEANARQQLIHKQGFSTAPVDDILDQIKEKLPGIKKKAGVEVLFSKWDKDELARHQSAELVDVTPLLIDALNPSEKQRQKAIEIQKHEPISLDKAGKIKD